MICKSANTVPNACLAAIQASTPFQKTHAAIAPALRPPGRSCRSEQLEEPLLLRNAGRHPHRTHPLRSARIFILPSLNPVELGHLLNTSNPTHDPTPAQSFQSLHSRFCLHSGMDSWIVALTVLACIVGIVVLTFVWSYFQNPTVLQLDDKVVVITGGSSGIGLACARVRDDDHVRGMRLATSWVQHELRRRQTCQGTRVCFARRRVMQEAASQGANVVLIARKKPGLDGEIQPFRSVRAQGDDKGHGFVCSSNWWVSGFARCRVRDTMFCRSRCGA